MARHPHIISNEQREARAARYRAAPIIGDYPNVGEVSIDMTFFDPEGKLQPSPRSRLFAADMQAYFEFSCPQRDCNGGGYDATAELQAALRKRKNGYSGSLICEGVRPRTGAKGQKCGLEMRCVMTVRDKKVVAAA